MNSNLAKNQEIELRQAFGDAICQKIADNIDKLAFPSSENLKLPVFNEAEFTLVTDPFTQSQDLTGYWYDTNRMRIGQIKFNCDGSFYAEFDVVKPHPTKKQFFVEAIIAWGKPENIKTEAKLLDIPI